MTWVRIIGITFVVTLIILYEWPKLGKQQHKEKAALICCTSIGWLLTATLLIFPNIQGPPDWIGSLLTPIGKSIRK